MRPAPGVILAGAVALGLVATGLVSAQTNPPLRAEPTPSAPPQAPPPAADPALPPEETVPAKLPDVPDKAAAKPSADDNAADDGDDKAVPADKKDAAPVADAAPTVDPAKRESHGAAIVQALDKITTETMRFEVRTGVPVRWKGLVFTLKSCQSSAPDEPVKDSIAWMTVRSEPRAQSAEASREVFRGWMFASSPALNPLEHPVYDAWLVACRA
jgi:hypothetical protein